MKAGKSGFTLMEILVAVVIFSLLMAAVMTAFQSFVRSSDQVTAAIRYSDRFRIPLEVIQRDLLQVRVSLPPVFTLPDSRPSSDVVDLLRIKGDETAAGSGTFSRLRFVSLGLLPKAPDEEGLPVRIVYYVRENSEGGFDLCRSETPLPWEPFEKNFCDPVLCPDISTFDIRYLYDGDTYETWDSESDAAGFSTPEVLSVTLGQASVDIDPFSGEEEMMETVPITFSLELPVHRRRQKK